MRAVRFHSFGGPDVLVTEEIPDVAPAAGQVLVRNSAAGINFADTMIRAGMNPQLPLPFVAGFESVGMVVGVGPGVDETWIGKRVVGSTTAGGGYAEFTVFPEDSVAPVPDGVDDHGALALHSHGSAALGILGAARVSAGETVVVTAAAGGVGSLLIQLAKAAGATVIGLAGGVRKVELVRALGADFAIDYSGAEWPDQVRRSAPDGVHVVLDTVGGEVAEKAFDLLVPARGRLVLAGLSSGRPPAVNVMSVLARGLEVIGYASVLEERSQAHRRAVDALGMGAAGHLRPVTDAVFPIEDSAVAHEAVENRATVGKVILTL